MNFTFWDGVLIGFCFFLVLGGLVEGGKTLWQKLIDSVIQEIEDRNNRPRDGL